MSLLDKLHDKALSATKKHVKYPLLVVSGIADWIAGTYGEIKGHGDAAKASGEERDYKHYEDGIQSAAFGEAGAFAAAVYTRNKAGAVILGADLFVRDIKGFISAYKEFKRLKEDPDAERVINVDNVDLTGAIGTARSLVYKLVNKSKRSDAVAEPAVEDDNTEVTPLIFPDPLPEPIPDDEMRIMGEKLEDKVTGAGGEDTEDDVLPFDPEPSVDPAPSPSPEQIDPEPVTLPGPEEGYALPDIMEEDEPSCGCGGRGSCGVSCGTSCRGDCGTKPAEDKPVVEGAPQAPSSKAKVDIGPLSRAQDDDDPLGSADGEDTGNKLF